MRDLRIIFMGTPEFAVPSLQILVENNYKVVAAITAPDKPKGRGRKLAPSAVKTYALSKSIPVLQPRNLKDPGFLSELKSLGGNLQVVVAFRMLPEVVWDMPAYGTINLHASLLPDYRGAAPINWAVINGEKETGVTTFFISHEIDTGDIILKEKEQIREDDNAGSLHDRLMSKGAELVLKTVKKIETNDYTTTPQDLSRSNKSAPKIQKETCEINWRRKAPEIHNFVRGLSPYPAAWTTINGRHYKIFSTKLTGEKSNDLPPGQFITDNKTFIKFQTADQLLSIEELQLQGKKRMYVEPFLRGNAL